MSSVIIIKRHFKDCDAHLDMHYSECIGTATIKMCSGKIKMSKWETRFKSEVGKDLFLKLVDRYSTVENFNTDEFINFVRDNLNKKGD